MFKSTLLSLLALAFSSMPFTLAVTEPSAVRFATTSSKACYEDKKDYFIPDGTCSSLPGKWLDVHSITATCRVFIYAGRDCTGAEQQVYPIQDNKCVDINSYYGIKAFCH